MLFIDVSRKEDTGIVKLHRTVHIPKQTLIDASHRHCLYFLSQVLLVHLHRNGNTYRHRLIIIFQRLVVPYNIGINQIIRARFL